MAAVEANAGVWGRHKSTKKKTRLADGGLKRGKNSSSTLKCPQQISQQAGCFLSELSPNQSRKWREFF
jgi:hypothetical protein